MVLCSFNRYDVYTHLPTYCLTFKSRTRERRARQNGQAQNNFAAALASLGQHAVAVAKHGDWVDDAGRVPTRRSLVPWAARRKGRRIGVRFATVFDHDERQSHGDQAQAHAQRVRGREVCVRRDGTVNSNPERNAHGNGATNRTVPV